MEVTSPQALISPEERQRILSLNDGERQEKALRSLGKVNAVITGSHFVYSSGKHGSDYVAKDIVGSYPTTQTRPLARLIAEHIMGLEPKYRPRIVLGLAPATIAFAHEVACDIIPMAEEESNIAYDDEVRFAYIEKHDDGEMFIARGFPGLINSMETAWIIEDVWNTGKSGKEAVKAFKKYCPGARLLGMAAICNRGGVTAEMLGCGDDPDFQTYALTNVEMATYDPEDCPHCRANVPLRTDIGHGAKWLETEAGQAWLASGGIIAT